MTRSSINSRPANARANHGVRSSEIRQRIRAVTARIIARHGIHGLRVEQVAEEAGVSPALLYYHFGSRSGLVTAAFELASEQAPSTALRLASDTKGGYEALESALVAELDDRPNVRDDAIVWGEVSARAVFEEDLRAGLRSINRAWRVTVAGAIERGIADGSIREDLDPQESAEILIVLVDGLTARWVQGSLELSRARELLRHTLQEMIRGSRDADSTATPRP